MNTTSIGLDSTAFHAIFELIQLFVVIGVALRAFYLYRKLYTARLLILLLSLILIAVTSISSLVGDNHLFSSSLNTNWFKYLGQSVSFAFIWLSAFQRSEQYLLRLKRCLLISTLLLLLLLLATPLLPPFPDPWTQTALSSLRAVVCLLIFFQYVRFFLTKGTRFSLLMGMAFLLLSFGYYIIFPKYLAPHENLLVTLGDSIRSAGLVLLLIAYFFG